MMLQDFHFCTNRYTFTKMSPKLDFLPFFFKFCHMVDNEKDSKCGKLTSSTLTYKETVASKLTLYVCVCVCVCVCERETERERERECEV